MADEMKNLARDGVEAIKDPKKLKKAILSNRKNILPWVGFATFLFFVYHLLSDGDFSFLMTLGSSSCCFAFGMLLLHMVKLNSCTGVSIKTLQVYAVVFFFRLCSIARHEGYLPYDKTGDWFYHGAEGLSFIMVCIALFLMYTKLASTYEEPLDSFGSLHVPAKFGAVYLVAPTLVMALILHPNLNNSFLADTAWTFACYLESVAILPQLFMFQKKGGGEVQQFISHFVFGLGFARFLHLWFWLSSYHELADRSGSNTVGVFVLIAQFLHLILMADFFYYYLISVKKGTSVMLPTQAGLV